MRIITSFLLQLRIIQTNNTRLALEYKFLIYVPVNQDYRVRMIFMMNRFVYILRFFFDIHILRFSLQITQTTAIIKAQRPIRCQKQKNK